MARSGRQITFMQTLARPVPVRRGVDIVMLDRDAEDNITLKFLSGPRRLSREVRLGPDLAESLLSMLSLELDPPFE